MYRFTQDLEAGQLLVNGRAVFQVVVAKDHVRVITVITVPYLERQRAKCGKKATKIRRKQIAKLRRSLTLEADDGG